MSPNSALLTVTGLELPAAEALAVELEAAWQAPDAVSIDEQDEALGLWSVTGYYPELAPASAAAAALTGRGFTATAGMLAPQDWVRRSLQGLAPVTAGRFQLYGSHDRGQRRAGGIALEIDAGTAFGTGHHGTTAGCLLALDDLLKRQRPRAVLDAGCGTGVLALAAAAALKRRITAGDIDPVAVDVTRANGRINGLAPLITAVTAVGLTHRAIAGARPFDLIFANILAGPLMALAADITSALGPGGRAILSGLTQAQIRPVAAAYRNRGLVLERRLILAPWAVLVLARKN